MKQIVKQTITIVRNLCKSRNTEVADSFRTFLEPLGKGCASNKSHKNKPPSLKGRTCDDGDWLD